jgi:hypothetical protein
MSRRLISRGGRHAMPAVWDQATRAGAERLSDVDRRFSLI